MLGSQRKKSLSFILLALSCLFFHFALPTVTSAQASQVVRDEGVRADLPLGGELRVENGRGSITIKVWNEKHVSITAKMAGSQSKSLPVVIQRTERLLSIGVARQASRRARRVDLILRIPERTRAEILTASGEVNIRGLPATLSVQTVSGDIRAEFPATTEASISAESTRGKVASTLTTDASAINSEHVFQARIGTATKPVRIRSRRGRITLAASQSTTDETATATVEAARKPPTLVNAENASSGAGTPATVLTLPEEVDEGDVVRVDTELVTLNMSVVDRGTSRGLSGLAQSDFKLYEDGTEQRLAHFESSSAPFNLLLLVDLSGSTREVVQLVRAAALRFVASARPADRIAVITFASAPVIVSRLTDDRNTLRQRINAIEQPQGSTKLYDALAFAMREVLKDSRDSRRNAIVLMSDGLDSSLPNVTGDGSTLTYKELLSEVREFDGVLYSLWLNTEYESLSPLDVQPETFDAAHDQMKELAEAGGGMFYEVEKLEDLAGAYERVVADLGTVYSLSYRPTNTLRDGKWRAIRITVSRQNAVARGKRGYYAK